MLFVIYYYNNVSGEILEQHMKYLTQALSCFPGAENQCGDVKRTRVWNLKVLLAGRGAAYMTIEKWSFLVWESLVGSPLIQSFYLGNN